MWKVVSPVFFFVFQCYRATAVGLWERVRLPENVHSPNWTPCFAQQVAETSMVRTEHQLTRKRIHMSRYFLPARDGTKRQVRFVHVSVLVSPSKDRMYSQFIELYALRYKKKKSYSWRASRSSVPQQPRFSCLWIVPCICAWKKQTAKWNYHVCVCVIMSCTTKT